MYQSSRFEAVQIGQKLAEELQLFYCVYDNDRPFLDNAHTYYQYYNHDTTSLHWLKKTGSRNSKKGTEEMGDDELSQTGSLEDDDLFDECAMEKPSLAQNDLNENTGDNIEDEADDPVPKMKMSAFNMSMRMIEDEEEEDLNSSGMASISTADKNSSVVDALLFEDSTRYFDKYGFAVDNDAENEMYVSSGDLHKKYAGCNLNDDEWGELLDECSAAPPGTISKASLTKMKHSMRLGLSDCHRQRAWTLITGVNILIPEKVGEYNNFVKQGFKSRSSSIAGVANNRSQTLRGVIERDLYRTFPRHILFSGSNIPSPEEQTTEIKLSGTSNTYSEVSVDSDDAPSQISSSISTSGEIMSAQELCGTSGPEALRRILYAYSIYDPGKRFHFYYQQDFIITVS